MKKLFLMLALVLLALISCAESVPTDEESNTAESTQENEEEVSSETTANSADISAPSSMSADDIFAQINRDEYVALYCGDLLSGGEIWYGFLDKVSSGKEASVLIVNYYPPQGQYDEDSSIFLEEIRFNGNTYEYIFSSYPQADDPDVSEYKYIKKYELENEDVYILVNSDTYTYEQIIKSFATSISSELIDCQWLIEIPK